MPEKPELLRQAMAKLQTRTFTIDRDAEIDTDTRTVSLAFASDKPIEHWFGNLILSMDKKAVRTERLSSGAPLLMDHNSRDQIGVVENFSFDKGGVARADVRFSNSTRGQEIFQDVKDGIRQNVSVGFMVYGMELVEEKKDAMPTYRCDDWEPMEISLVSIPADISVGIGRSYEEPVASNETDYKQALELARGIIANDFKNSISKDSPEERGKSNQEKIMAKEDIETPETPAGHTRSPELIAADEVREWGVQLGEQDLAKTYVRDCMVNKETPSKEGFFARVKAAQPATIEVPVIPAREEAARQGGIQLARSVPRYGTLRNFKGENAAERAYRFGQWFLAARGISAGLPGEGAFARAAKFCRENGVTLTRAMSEGVNESGGFLVPEEFGNDLIDLREQYGVFRRNAKMVPMASDTRSDPRRTGGLTAYFEGEGDAGTASDKSWDRVSLTAKKLMVLARWSSEVQEDAVINMGDDLAGEIAYAYANKEDLCGFIGDGSSTYGGMQGVTTKIKGLSATIANIAGLFVGAGNAYSELVLTDFEGVVGLLPQYADTPSAKWFVHRSFYWNVMVEARCSRRAASRVPRVASGRGPSGSSATTSRLRPGDAEGSEAVSQVCALLGDLRLAASFGSRRDTTIAISEHSRFANDEIEIRGTERFDINVHDVGNASATAGSRVAGPIVGLITAAS
jgi:HK97 family phage major capsid protein